MFPVYDQPTRVRLELGRYASSSEPGVKWLHRHEPADLLPSRRDEAVAHLAHVLDVPAAEVVTVVEKTVDGHTKIRASWTPP